MSKVKNYKNRFIELMSELSSAYPSYGLGRHLSTALSEYGDFWDISDKELCYAIEKYKTELDLDQIHVVSDEYLEDIIEDANHLFDNKEEMEED
jgi:hypothetical protein